MRRTVMHARERTARTETTIDRASAERRSGNGRQRQLEPANGQTITSHR